MFSQKQTCDGKKENIVEDFNSIVEKCTTVKANKKSSDRKKLSVRVSARKNRFLKKNKIKPKKKPSKINRIASTTNSKKITKYISESKPLLYKKEENEIASKSVVKKEVVAKENTINTPHNLSIEQLKKAKKFSDVENIPSFNNCKDTSSINEQLECFNTEMIKHIEENFQYPNEAIVKKLQGEVWIRFIITKDGGISNIKAVKGDKILKEEAIRVVSLLPNFVPAKNKGARVAVKYGFPIMFALNEN